MATEHIIYEVEYHELNTDIAVMVVRILKDVKRGGSYVAELNLAFNFFYRFQFVL